MKLRSPVHRKHSRIEIIPLIDIMFFLLASFMMVSLQMDRAENIKVNLPAASQSKADFKPDMLNITVDKAGLAWFEKKQIDVPDLGAVLSNRFRRDPDSPVYIGGDRDTLHGAMVRVLQAVRQAGFQTVAFTVGEAPSRDGK
jgi:biopolymer transport protein ExbD